MFLGLTMSRISTSPQTAILQWYCLRSCQPWSQPPVFIHCRQGSDNHVYSPRFRGLCREFLRSFLQLLPFIWFQIWEEGQRDGSASQITCHASLVIYVWFPKPMVKRETGSWSRSEFPMCHGTHVHILKHTYHSHTIQLLGYGSRRSAELPRSAAKTCLLSSTSPHGWWAWVMGSGERTRSTACLHVLPRRSRLACCLLRLGVWQGLVKFDFGIITEHLRQGKESHWITCDSFICMSPNKNLENHSLP